MARPNDRPEIEVGDQIQYGGFTYTIADIIWQDYDHGYCWKGHTTDGVYRTWKQDSDGGELRKRRVVGESKTDIVKALETLLKLTRQFSDLDYCKYVEDGGNQYVWVVGKPNETGYRWKYKCNVTWDSGIALIRDVLAQIG